MISTGVLMINDTFWRPINKYLTKMHATEDWVRCVRHGADRCSIITVKAIALLCGQHNQSPASFVFEVPKFKCD
jgi:hypothetical protein